MNGKLTKKAVLAGAFVILIAVALPKMNIFKGAEKTEEKAGGPSRGQSIEVRTHIVQEEKVGDKVETVGTLLSNEEVEIRSEISGKIEKIFFTEGSKVEKGAVLVKIDDAELRAKLLQAEARQSLAEQQEARQRSLFEKDLVSRQEYDNVLTNLNLMRAEVQLVKAQLAKSEISAPFGGTIGLRHVSEGSYLTPAALITTLQDRNRVKIDFAIPEKHAASITPGDKIAFKIQGDTRTFTGSIYAVDPKIDIATRTLRLRALSDNRDGALLPGSLATVALSFKEKKTLMIPSYALIPDLKGHKVFLYKSGTAESRSVLIGMRTSEFVEIARGLEMGDTLITSGILQLRPGMPVRLGRQEGPSAGAVSGAPGEQPE